VLLGDQSEAQSGSAIAHNRDAVDVERGSADATAIELGSAHACANAFHDQGAFELSHGRDDHHEGTSQRTVCIDCFTLRKKLDAEVVQLVEDLQEMLGAMGEAIAGPDQHDVKAMAVGVAQQSVQRRSPGFCARDSVVGELVNDLESALAGELAELVQLHLRMLVQH
jgi:hypothetical protein